MASTVCSETLVLLLPDQERIEVDAKAALLTLHGVMGVAVHSFQGIPDRHTGAPTRKWYASVTFNSFQITQDKVRKVTQNLVNSDKRVIDLNKGRLQQMNKSKPDLETGSVSTTEGGADASAKIYSMADEEDSAGEKGKGGYGLQDDLNEWYHDGYSDSDDESYEKAGSPGYLDEELGKRKAQVNFFAPLVGVLGADAAQTLNEEYNTWGVQPYTIKPGAKVENQGLLSRFSSLWGGQ